MQNIKLNGHLKYRKNPKNLTVQGKTREYRETLKELGGKWNSHLKAWVFKHSDEQKLIESFKTNNSMSDMEWVDNSSDESSQHSSQNTTWSSSDSESEDNDSDLSSEYSATSPDPLRRLYIRKHIIDLKKQQTLQGQYICHLHDRLEELQGLVYTSYFQRYLFFIFFFILFLAHVFLTVSFDF